jgi:hypothetical protein
MKLFINRYIALAAVAVLGIALFAPAAQAQYRPRYGRAFPVVQNRYPAFVPTQLQQSALRNWAYNTQVIGNAYASVPPWVYGYNPYPPVVNYGPVVPMTGYYSTPYPTYVSPYSYGGYSAVNPYAGAYVNPYGY